jgi:hypothetical protein
MPGAEEECRDVLRPIPELAKLVIAGQRKTVGVHLDLFEQDHSKAAAGELGKLFADLRSNLGQQARNREWLLELGQNAMEWIEYRDTDDAIREKSAEELRIPIASNSSK